MLESNTSAVPNIRRYVGDDHAMIVGQRTEYHRAQEDDDG